MPGESRNRRSLVVHFIATIRIVVMNAPEVSPFLRHLG
jgi:hypothetical protein